MFDIEVNQATCEGCEDCVDTCPVEFLGMEEIDAPNETGATEVAAVVGDECIGCESCITICPSGSLTLIES